MEDSCNYGTEFNFTYLTSEEMIPLKLGENHLSVSKENVSLTMIYTRWNGICYKINTTRNADFTYYTEIQLKTSKSKTLATTKIFFTSEENSYGVTESHGVIDNKFMDGKAFITHLRGKQLKVIDLSVVKNTNWPCRKESFFEYVASSSSESIFEHCNQTCFRTSFPNEIYRDEYLKTCTTIDYSGKINTEINNGESNELSIFYKFANPLRVIVPTAIVYQESLIMDSMGLVGSVGSKLGMYIGFSFSTITCIIGCVVSYLASRRKLPEAFWSSIEWFINLSLIAISIWFAWGVLDNFFSQDTAIHQYEEKINEAIPPESFYETKIHPTICICMGSWMFLTDFNIIYWHPESDSWLDLELGPNYMKDGNVYLRIIYTWFDGICYAVTPTRKMDERWTKIIIEPSYGKSLPGIIPVIVTSEMNSYGVTLWDWRNEEEFSFVTSGGKETSIDLKVEKNINLKCRDESFYEYVASRLSHDTLEKCNERCLMTSLPNVPYPICPNYEEWYSKGKKEKKSDCNGQILRDLIKNITINEEHVKTCVTTQYLGKITQHKIEYNGAYIRYKFALPLKAKVYEEYLITDGVTLIGSVGGTLGLFIGFSISNVVYSIVNFFKSTFETQFSGNFNIQR